MLTLWDLIDKKRRSPRRTSEPAAPRRRASADRYEQLTRQMLEQYQIRVRKWRSSMSGVAWQVTYTDGRVSRLIEAPRPRGPVSCSIFLHEVGHHAIGFNRYRPRCLEEYHAWRFAIGQMEANGIAVTDRVRERMTQSLQYAVSKALRRGLRSLPIELEPFRPPTDARRRP